MEQNVRGFEVNELCDSEKGPQRYEFGPKVGWRWKNRRNVHTNEWVDGLKCYTDDSGVKFIIDHGRFQSVSKMVSDTLEGFN